MTEDDYYPADKRRFLAMLAEAVPTDGPLETQCLVWTRATGGHGYGAFRLGGRTVKAHHMVLLVSGREIPPGRSVLHHCDVKLCVNVDHLFVGTSKDNTDDMMAKGRDRHGVLPGEHNGKAQLTEDQVRQIYDMAWEGVYTMMEIGDMFGVSASCVNNIKHKRAWKYLWRHDEPQED